MMKWAKRKVYRSPKEMRNEKEFWRVKMRLTASSILALTVCLVMLVSAASASYTTGISGGSASAAASGGATSGSQGEVNFNEDPSHDSVMDGLEDDHLVNLGQDFNDYLTEWIAAAATIPAGAKGTASAEYTTNGAKTVDQQLTDTKSLSVTLDGDVGVVLSKDTSEGLAQAYAAMWSRTGIDNDKEIGGSSGLAVGLEHTGLGEANAFATGSTSFKAYGYNGDYAKGFANGDINLQGSNDAEGGAFRGEARVTTETWVSPDEQQTWFGPEFTGTDQKTYKWKYGKVGESRTEEILRLQAERGVSFPGTSEVEGVLDGQEMGEASNNDLRVCHDIDCDSAGTQTVDLESTSAMNAMAVALNARDKASVNLEMTPEAELSWSQLYVKNPTLKTNPWSEVGHPVYNAEAYNRIVAEAAAERHVSGGSAKAQAEGYIPDATWASTALARNCLLASVRGATGQTQDGQALYLNGFGVGAWIMSKYSTPVTAKEYYDQYAWIDPKQKVLSTTYSMQLNGMKADLKTTNDAVGAFGAVKGQLSSVENLNTNEVSTQSPEDLTAINWLEGKNPDPLPGHWYPYTMVPTVTADAVSRQVALDWAA
jgi:hypothetical protein